jgi:hypothetical protein
MGRAVLSLSTMAVVLLLVSGVALAKPQPAPRQVPDASCKLHTRQGGLQSMFRNDYVAAQTFKVEHTGRLTSAKVRVSLVDQQQPTAAVMEIRTLDSSDTPTKVVKASTTIPVPSKSSVAIGYFRPGAPVEAGQQYAIVLHTASGRQAYWAGSTRNRCRNGLSYYGSGATGALENYPRNDHFFATYVTTREATEASTKGGGLGDTGGLPVLVPALLTLLISGAAIRLLVGRRL